MSQEMLGAAISTAVAFTGMFIIFWAADKVFKALKGKPKDPE